MTRMPTAADGIWTHVDLDGTITTNAKVDGGDDVATCSTCGDTIFRTNMAGRWHHPRPTDHPAEWHRAG